MFINNIIITNPRTTSEFETALEHAHSDKHQMILANNNIGGITIKNRKFSYAPGTIYFAARGVRHTVHNRIGTDYFIVFFSVTDPKLEEALQKLPYEIKPYHPLFIRNLFIQMHACKHSRSDLSDFYLYSCFSLLLTSVINNSICMFLLTNENIDMFKFLNADNSFDKLLEFLASSYSNDITIDLMIKYSGYQRAQLFRLFKARFGTTPMRYVNRLRINFSKPLLSDHNISITDIAFRMGFGSASAFTRTFYRLEGCSPREYRKHNRP